MADHPARVGAGHARRYDSRRAERLSREPEHNPKRDEIRAFDLYGFDASPSGGAACFNGTVIDCLAHSARDPEQNVDGFALGHGTQHDFRLVRCETFDGFDISADDTVLKNCVS